jgi:hypothetical protein
MGGRSASGGLTVSAARLGRGRSALTEISAAGASWRAGRSDIDCPPPAFVCSALAGLTDRSLVCRLSHATRAAISLGFKPFSWDSAGDSAVARTDSAALTTSASASIGSKITLRNSRVSLTRGLMILSAVALAGLTSTCTVSGRSGISGGVTFFLLVRAAWLPERS